MPKMPVGKGGAAMSDRCHFCDVLNRSPDLPADQLVGKFPHSIVLLAPWQYYTGYCILVSRVHATELFQLPDANRQALLDEVTLLAQVLHQEFQPRKINYELLGNQVPHIHWHIIPRYESDPDHLKPAWIALDQAERDAQLKARLIGSGDRVEIARRIRAALERGSRRYPLRLREHILLVDSFGPMGHWGFLQCRHEGPKLVARAKSQRRVFRR